MIILCATISAFVTGCVYDWEVGAPASADAGPGTGGAGGAGGSGGPDCADLQADVEAARIAAKSCVLGASGQCAEKVTDECGCHSFVKAGGSAEVQGFVAAVEAFQAADCKPSCAASCSVVVTGMCLIVGGQGPYCTP
ncbi:hypothetical protein [Polyangium sp. y55x31]|uniref:hypothetical protein n=1 Tax=Polyangium sp. y55x31 TaxID=3042688 RepID=UPI0024826F85|nr:hypothetical protein [Polyangium sp. y55x31]MDI1477673.1 hypothetical protein [Polyangium sp. y55x31]